MTADQLEAAPWGADLFSFPVSPGGADWRALATTPWSYTSL